MASQRQVDELAQKIFALEGQVRALSSRSRLANSSIESGAVREFNADGQLVGQYGQQWDGTSGAASFNGPTPPTPTAPVLESVMGGVKVTWDGLFAGGAVAPMDFARVEVHAAGATTLRTTFETPRGGSLVVALPQGTHSVWLVTRSLSGKASAPSVVVQGDSGRVQREDLDTDVGGTTVHYGSTDPTGAVNGDLWYAEVSAGLYETRRMVNGAWVALADQSVSQAVGDALVARQIAESKSKVTVTSTAPASPEVGDYWRDSVNGNLLSRWDGSTWVPVYIGNGSFQPNSIIAKDVIATGTVTASLLEAVMILASVFVAGDPAGFRLEIRPDGIYQINDDGSVATELSSTGLNHLSLAGGAATISSTGEASFEGVSVSDSSKVFFAGMPLQEILNARPRGRVARGVQSVDSAATRTGIGLFEVSADLKAGDRTYEFKTSSLMVQMDNASVGDVGEVRIYATFDGSQPSLASTIIASSRFVWDGSPQSVYCATDYVLKSPAPHTIRALLSIHVLVGGATTTAKIIAAGTRQIELYIDDVGPWRESSGAANDGGGLNGGAGGSTDAAGNPTTGGLVTQKMRREIEVTSTWNSSYRQNGTRRIVNGLVFQGRLDSTFGDQYGMWGFPDVTADLAGISPSDIEYAEYTIQARHWHQPSGGFAWMGYHAHTASPVSSPAGSFRALGAFPFGRGQKRTLRIPPSLFFRLIDGTLKGLTLGPAQSSSLAYYGTFEATARWNIVYYK